MTYIKSLERQYINATLECEKEAVRHRSKFSSSLFSSLLPASPAKQAKQHFSSNDRFISLDLLFLSSIVLKKKGWITRPHHWLLPIPSSERRLLGGVLSKVGSSIGGLLGAKTNLSFSSLLTILATDSTQSLYNYHVIVQIQFLSDVTFTRETECGVDYLDARVLEVKRTPKFESSYRIVMTFPSKHLWKSGRCSEPQDPGWLCTLESIVYWGTHEKN